MNTTKFITEKEYIKDENDRIIKEITTEYFEVPEDTEACDCECCNEAPCNDELVSDEEVELLPCIELEADELSLTKALNLASAAVLFVSSCVLLKKCLALH